MSETMSIKNKKVYVERNTDKYRIGGKFTILKTMFTIIAISSLVIILFKLATS